MYVICTHSIYHLCCYVHTIVIRLEPVGIHLRSAAPRVWGPRETGCIKRGPKDSQVG